MSDKTKKESNKLKRYFDLEVLTSDTQPIIDSKIRKIAKTMKAPGFRPGKVPIEIVKQTHGIDVESEAINEVINKKYSEAVKSQNYKPAGPPNIEPLSDGNNSVQSSEKLVFRAEIEVLPEIKIPDLKGLVVKK